VVLWRKPTNAPNKFMGSGMLPAGAYVTLEHEYVLVFRKKGKRSFRDDSSRRLRRQSAFFWEERNNWFSDVWTIRPVGQVLAGSLHRERSGAFPLELAARLINMYSLQQDTILDPFAGTGTTMLASLGCGRNSIGVELDEGFRDSIEQAITTSGPELNALVQKRLSSHRAFVERHEREKGPIRYRNTVYDFPVVTRQETDLAFPYLAGVRPAGDGEFVAAHELGEPQPELRLQ
jgi:DNA modification methylase